MELKKMESNKMFGDTIYLFSYTMILILHLFLNASSLKYHQDATYQMLSQLKTVFLILSLMRVFTLSYKLKELLTMGAIGLLVLMVTYQSKSSILLTSYLLMIGAKEINLKKIAILTLSVLALTTCFIILFAQLNLLDNLQLFRVETGEIRYSLGFGHPNTLGMIFLVICLLWMYIRYETIKWWDFSLWGILCVVIDQLINSRTSLYMIFLLIGLIIVFKIFPTKLLTNRFFKLTIVLLFPILLMITVFLMLNYPPKNELFRTIDKLVSGRIRLANFFYNEYGVQMFGQPIKLIGTIEAQYNFSGKPQLLDNMYMQLLVHYGWWATTTFIGSYVLFMKRAFKHQDVPIIIFSIVIAVYGLTEVYPLNLLYNFSLLAMMKYYGNADKKMSPNIEFIK